MTIISKHAVWGSIIISSDICWLEYCFIPFNSIFVRSTNELLLNYTTSNDQTTGNAWSIGTRCVCASLTNYNIASAKSLELGMRIAAPRSDQLELLQGYRCNAAWRGKVCIIASLFDRAFILHPCEMYSRAFSYHWSPLTSDVERIKGFIRFTKPHIARNLHPLCRYGLHNAPSCIFHEAYVLSVL